MVINMGEGKISPEKLLMEGRTIQFTPMGYSMYPLLVPGRDQAVVAPMGDTVPRRGDVVLYRRIGGILVLHRVWKHKRDGFYMVGDNEKTVEGPLQREQLKGILVAVVRKGRSFSADHILYRMAAGLWLWLRPFRPHLAGLLSKCRRRR
ncbi:MAG: S24/S26 family peptidase [Muribaculum sp.]|nr:S24/S26 family peptidase [Muribaculum sp.]